MGESLFNLACNLGWLNVVDTEAETEEPVYAFFHPTFQEYFAAQAIADWHYFLNHVPHNPVEGTYRIFEPQWKEVILLWLGRENMPRATKEEFIKNLMKFEFEDRCERFYWFRACFLAAAGIAEFRECSPTITVEIMGQLMIIGFGYLNPQLQNLLNNPFSEGARAALQETERNIAIAVLTYLLSYSQDEYSRLKAAESLGQIDPGNLEAIKALIKLMRHSRGIRQSAAWSLQSIGTGNSEAIKALIELLDTSQDEDVRLLAAESLGQIDSGNSKAITFLVELLRLEFRLLHEKMTQGH